MRILLTTALLFYCGFIFAQSSISGKAVRILDGDTFEILLENHSAHKVRLTDIDAPEKRQDFGEVARQRLAFYIFGKEVRVVYDKLDRNKRILGHVYTGNDYINLKMVEDGLAWHFKKYSKDHRFAVAEMKAKRVKKGLWILSGATAPWDFRAKRK